MKEALSDDDPRMRMAALLRLERAKMKKRTAHLVDALKDDDPGVVLLAAQLLRNDKAQRAKVVSALRSLLSEEKETTAREARILLAFLGDAKALAAVESSLLTDDESDILPLLSKLRDVVPLRKTFVSLLADDRDAVRIEAAQAVLSIRP